MLYITKFHEAHRKEKGMLKKYLHTVDYLSILEGHPKSGYVHAHDLYFLNVLPTDSILSTIANHWNNMLCMGSREHGIKIEIKEPKDVYDIKSLIAYPMSYVGKTTISALPEWTKYDVIFNTCLWLSGKPKVYGGIEKRVRAFQPSRSLSTIMNKVTHDPDFEYIETMLKTESDYRSLHKLPDYDERIKVWMMFGGDNEQFATLKELTQISRLEKLIAKF